MLFASFTKFALLASLASSALALPTTRAEEGDLSLDKRHYKKTTKLSGALGTCKSSIDKRKTDLTVKLGVLSNPSAHAVAAIVVPCVNGIIADVRVATSALSAGKASLEVDFDVQAGASLVAGIITSVLGCLGPVLKLLSVLLSIVAGLVPGLYGVFGSMLEGVSTSLKMIGLGGMCSLLSI